MTVITEDVYKSVLNKLTEEERYVIEIHEQEAVLKAKLDAQDFLVNQMQLMVDSHELLVEMINTKDNIKLVQ